MPLQGIPSLFGGRRGAAAAGVNIGFNFRGTAGFVTDGANQTYVLGSDAYPTTRAGFTFGWVQTGSKPANGADRDSGVGDVQLAGINYVEDWNGTTSTYFRVDLTAGTYNIRVAAGDASFGGSTDQYVSFNDTTTERFHVGPGALSAGHFYDALSVDYTTAAWPGSNSPQTGISIATGQLRMIMGQGTSSQLQIIASIVIYS